MTISVETFHLPRHLHPFYLVLFLLETTIPNITHTGKKNSLTYIINTDAELFGKLFHQTMYKNYNSTNVIMSQSYWIIQEKQICSTAKTTWWSY